MKNAAAPTTRRTLLTAGVLGLSLVGLKAGLAAAEGDDVAAVEKAALQVHDDFVKLWNADNADPEKLADFFPEDGLVHTGVHTGRHQLFVGRAAILQQFKSDFTDGRYYFKIMKTWGAGPMVIHSRTHTSTKKGPVPGPFVGVFYIKGKKILEWGEYTY